MSANSVKRTAWASAFLLLASFGAQFGTARGQEKSSNSPNPDSAASDAQGTIPATKVKVHRGSIDDIDAIGKRKLYKEFDWYSEARETEVGKRQAQELEQGQKLLVDMLGNSSQQHLTFSGTLNGLSVTFDLIGNSPNFTYSFTIQGKNVGTQVGPNPVKVSLAIGNNSGSTTVNF